jgi:microcystin degradation protein MlrC
MTTAPAGRPRVAIGSIFQESNHFAARRTDLALFRNTYILEGEEVLGLAGTDCETAGMLAVCERQGVAVAPLLAARSVSGGILTDECYRMLKETLLGRLRAAGPVGGVLLAMHGAMAAESEEDPEGDLLLAVRRVVGVTAPIVMTLDLHAHVTPRMVEQATGLVAFMHYPHDDAFATGERGADLLLRMLRGAARPVMALAKARMIVTGLNCRTSGDGPMARLERRARALEREPGILSVSVLPVQPFLDVPDMGCGALVIADGDADLAERHARAFAEEFWRERHAFEPEILPVAEAVRRGRAVDGGPVLLVDTADAAGGGAAGDSAALLRELLALGVTEPTLLMVVDPVVAADCHRAGVGSALRADLGHRIDPTWGEPVAVTGTVEALGDGRFRYTGGIFGGSWASMGPSAVLRIGGIRALVMSQPTYDWADEQYRAAGLDPRAAKFVGVKNPMNYRLAYHGVAKADFIVDTPGPTPATVRRLPFKRLQRPFFPLDDDGPAIQAVSSREAAGRA